MQPSTKHGSRFPYALVIIFLIFAAGIIAIGYTSYRTYSRHFRMQVEYQLSAIADLKVDELVQWRLERLNDAQTLYKNPIFSQLAENFLDNPLDSDAQKKLLLWLNSFLAHTDYERIFLLDTRGAIRLSAPEASSIHCRYLPENAGKALDSGQIVFLDLHRDTADSPPHMALLVPLYDAQTGRRPLGIIALRITPDIYLYPLINRWPTSSSTAETLLVRRDGASVLFLNELKFQKNTALNLRFPLTNLLLPAARAALGREGIFEGRDYLTKPVIAALRRVPDSPWFLVARMDTAEIFAPLQARFWTTIILVISIFCGLAAVVFGLWRQKRMLFYREQLQASEALRASEIRYRRLFETAKDGILILDAETGMVVEVNPFLIKLLCFSREAFLEKEIWELGFFKDIIASKENFTELQDKEYIRYEDLPLETAAGQRIEVEFVSNVYLVNGKKVIQCNIRDITVRKQAERALALQAKIATIFITASDEEMYNEVLLVILEVMQSPFGVFGYLDTDGSLIVPTMTRQIWDRCQMPDKTIRFPRETWGDSSWHRAIREKKANYTNERSSKTPEGHVVLARHISLPIMLGEKVIGLFQVANKTTDYTGAEVRRLQSIADHVAPILNARLSRERYEKKLQETNAELTRITYTMSHDLKSPLVTVKTFLGYLEKDLQKQDASRIEKDFFFIHGAADKMGRLLDELLELTRIGRVLNPEVEAPLQDIVNEALAIVAGQVARRGVRVEITQQPLLLRGDRVRLVELFQNLIDNAVKFMGDQKEPKIEIGLKTKNGENLLFVLDNGVGIDPLHIDKVFDLFEKFNPEMEGTGMGLALAKRIVEVHGGRIWIESEGLGKGACVCFTLPKGSSELGVRSSECKNSRFMIQNLKLKT